MLWTGSEAITMPKLHEIYGSVVRVAPRELSFNDAAAWKAIYGHNTGGKTRTFEKDPRFYTTNPQSTRHIGTADDPNHTRQRRILANSFSDKVCNLQSSVSRIPLDMKQTLDTRVQPRADFFPGIARPGTFAEAMGWSDGYETKRS